VLRIVIAGLLGGAAFALFSMIWFGLGGKTVWYPLNLVAHTLWRGAPTDGTFHPGAALLGAMVLAAIGVVVLAPFAAAAAGSGMGVVTAIIGASVYANLIWVFGHYLVWEKLDPEAADRFAPGVAWAGHLLAGLVGGAALVWLTSRDYAIGGKPG
jgi:hypothetical protein